VNLTKDRTSDLFGTQAVGIAVQTPGQPVRPVHHHHPLASPESVPLVRVAPNDRVLSAPITPI
jgi:hypothetical protein